MNIPLTIRAIQTKLGITCDGLAGPQTWAAIAKALGVADASPACDGGCNGACTGDCNDTGHVDERSEHLIATLLPEVRPYARALVKTAAQHDITLIVTSGTRSYAEQDQLYRRGRMEPGNVVTYAQGGYSNHNFGIAFDVTIFAHGEPVWESPLYKAIGAWGKALGLAWGGDWHATKSDEPHFELRPKWAEDLSESAMLVQLRHRQALRQEIYS